MHLASCPVCEASLDFLPWNGSSASDEICPSCGIQFGYNDARPDLRERIYSGWRTAWIENGRQPLTGDARRRIGDELLRETKPTRGSDEKYDG